MHGRVEEGGAPARGRTGHGDGVHYVRGDGLRIRVPASQRAVRRTASAAPGQQGFTPRQTRPTLGFPAAAARTGSCCRWPCGGALQALLGQQLEVECGGATAAAVHGRHRAARVVVVAAPAGRECAPLVCVVTARAAQSAQSGPAHFLKGWRAAGGAARSQTETVATNAGAAWLRHVEGRGHGHRRVGCVPALSNPCEAQWWTRQ